MSQALYSRLMWVMKHYQLPTENANDDPVYVYDCFYSPLGVEKNQARQFVKELIRQVERCGYRLVPTPRLTEKRDYDEYKSNC